MEPCGTPLTTSASYPSRRSERSSGNSSTKSCKGIQGPAFCIAMWRWPPSWCYWKRSWRRPLLQLNTDFLSASNWMFSQHSRRLTELHPHLFPESKLYLRQSSRHIGLYNAGSPGGFPGWKVTFIQVFLQHHPEQVRDRLNRRFQCPMLGIPSKPGVCKQ